jgi:hypothetical protein
MLMVQQLLFNGDPPGKTYEFSGTTDHAVAWNDQSDRVLA